MIFGKNREEIRRLAKRYQLPESEVRHMLAIKSGASTGDVKIHPPGKRSARPGWMLSVLPHLFTFLLGRA